MMNDTVTHPSNTTDLSGENGVDYFTEYAGLIKSIHTMSLVVNSLAFIVGVLGNGVVIWVTGFKMKKTVNTVWFLNLAIADLLFTSCLPLTVIQLALELHRSVSEFLCKMNSTLTILNLFASVYILMVISIDRCVSVVWPIWAQNHRSVRTASCVSLGVWILALIHSTPYFVFRDIETYIDGGVFCYYNFAFSNGETPSVIELRQFRHKAIAITRFVLGFLVPFTVIVSCYSVIIYHIRRNRTLASQSSRSFKIIAAVITTFFLCWAPYHILSLIDLVNLMSEQSETLFLIYIVGIPLAIGLVLINCCLNPFLYVCMGQDFKDKVRKSIQSVLETAFQDDVSGSQTDKIIQSQQQHSV